MNQRVELVYVQGGNKENEDAYVVDEQNGIFAAIDGATGLGGISGKMAAEFVKSSLEMLEENQTILEGLQLANERIGLQTFEEMDLANFNLIPKEARSTCGLAVIKLEGDRLEFAHAGDCMIFIEQANGEVRSLTYDHLAKLDSASIELFHQTLVSMIDTEANPDSLNDEHIASLLGDARQTALPLIIENRRKLNTHAGYGIIDGSEEALSFVDYGSISLQSATRILLVSDGLQLPIQKGSGSAAWQATAKFAFDNGLDALKEEVLRLEQSDKMCVTYPRLKFADDKTGIMLKLL